MVMAKMIHGPYSPRTVLPCGSKAVVTSGHIFTKQTAKPQKPPRCTATFKLPHTELSAAKRGCVSSSWLLLATEEYIFPVSSSKVRGFRRSYSHGIKKFIKKSCGSFKVHTKTVS